MKVGIQYREARVSDLEVDQKDGNTIKFSFSSEEPCKRWYGDEVLSHAPGAMNLVRVEAGAAPFLWNHDADQPLGMVKAAKVSGKIGRAEQTYFSTPFAQEKKQQYLEGLRNVSFAYQIDQWKKTREAVFDDAGRMTVTPEYTATKYTVYEMSQVSVPADFTVGIGRGLDGEQNFEARRTHDEKNGIEVAEEKDELAVPPIETKKEEITPTPLAVVAPKNNSKGENVEVNEQIANARKESQQQERERQTNIRKLCEKHQLGSDFTNGLIDKGTTLEEARTAILEKISTRQAPVADGITPNPADVGLSLKELQKFSFVRLMHALANPQDARAQEGAKFEREVSVAGQKIRGKEKPGFYVPPEVLRFGKRDLTKGVAADGGDLVATDLVGFIELLRNKSVVQKAGATVLNGLVGDIAIPKQTGGATAYWIAENADITTESTQAFGQVALTPKGLGAYSDVSRKLLLQSSIDVENLMRSDLAAVVALAMDLAAVYGTGADNQPKGVTLSSAVRTKNIASAAAPTFLEIIDMETKIFSANADAVNMKYLCNPSTRGYAKGTAAFSNTGTPIWGPDNRMNGYDALVSNQITANDILFGNWADMLIGFWSGLDIMVDPYVGALAGRVRVIALQDVDVAIRHGESFCFGQNGLSGNPVS